MIKLLILSQDCEIYERLIAQENIPSLSILAVRSPGDAFQEGQGIDIIFGEPSLISKVISQVQGLKWVQSTWAGVEPLLELGLPKNYLLTNARSVYGSMMSEYVFGYILAIERQILSRWQSQMNKEWDAHSPGRLIDKKLGLLGVGSIGRHLAKMGKNFGMNVVGYTRRSETCCDVDRYFHTGEILDFVIGLDYLVCSLPGTTQTRNLVTGEVFSALPKTTWLINIGRGSVIDENALIDALNRHLLAGAVLDVFFEEPLPPNHPLWRTPNTYLTFHTAAKNYPPDIADLFIKNYYRFIDGKTLNYQVDFNLQY
jgi:phosphoglycerate dehydrogenase-like enzyme